MPDGYADEVREALLAKAAQAWEHDPALDPQAIGDGSGGDSGSCYLSAYYQRKATADELAAELRHVLDDVRVAVEDQARMGATARDLAAGLGGEPGSDQAEHADLLRWLADGNFLFLGYREYDIVRTADGAGLRAVPGTGLGILRHSQPGKESVRKMSSQVARRAQDPAERLVLAKANPRSTVYRASYLDYVSVKKLGPDETVI